MNAKSAILSVLLIEDSAADRVRLIGQLESSHQNELHVHAVDNMEQGLAFLARQTVDVVLVDLTLPDGVGLQNFRRIESQTADVPVIVMAVPDQRDIAFEAVRSGAADFLMKTDVRIRQLHHMIRRAIERHNERSVDETVAVANEDARVAREILFNLYPHTALVLPGYDLAGMTYPADIVGADYFDYLPMGEDSIGLVIGDGAGHGLGPALLVTQTQACLSALAQTVDCPGEMLTRANAVLDERMPPNRFVTLLLVALDPAERTIRFVNAGHPAGFVFGSDGTLKRRLVSEYFPLGIECDSVYLPSDEIALSPGDVVVMVTDGVVEATSSKREAFGEERLIRELQANIHRGAQAIVERIYDAVIAHLDGRTQHDDVTALVLRVD